MKKYISTGLIILLPIAVTVFIVLWLVDFLTKPFYGFVEHLLLTYETAQGLDVRSHAMLVTFISKVSVLIFLFFVIVFLGIVARRFFFHHLVTFSRKILSKIPVIKTIYNLSHEVTSAFLSQKENIFKKTVLIPFPNGDTHALGLVTGETPLALRRVIEDAELTVFVPTAPHPVSGYLLLAPRKQLINLDMTTEETFRFLLSCGMAVPSSEKPEVPKTDV